LPYKFGFYEADEPIEFVHFIETGVGSLVNTMQNGDAAEVGTIGNEGMVGLPVVLGASTSPMAVYMQVAGSGLRLRASILKEELDRSSIVRMSMLQYADTFFNQVAQSAACNTFHALERRCCRWLLMTHDRMQSTEFPLTQEFLAMMLGVRRSGVSVVASALQRVGLITYTHGTITILDYESLQKRACECYSVNKREFDRLLGKAPQEPRPRRVQNNGSKKAQTCVHSATARNLPNSFRLW
jgi:CRP-like cAMP-binding protein